MAASGQNGDTPAATAPAATAALSEEARRAGMLRVATAGSVDDGKSTLIGRLLYDSKQVFQDQYDAVERTSTERGDGYVNLALLTDGLRAEREQGITIDVAYRYFATPRRKFIIADTPGHVRYTRNMVTGASTADLSIVLIDARNGVVEQSRRHAFIASLLGVPHLVVGVNKMDLVDWDCKTFEKIAEEFSQFAARLDIRDITFIPISALQGDNVVERSKNMPWYEGPPLLYHLEHVVVASDRNLIDARFPVQWVIRPMTDEHHDYRSYAGQVAGGILRPGEDVVVLPSGARTKIAAIDVHGGSVEEAYPPMSVSLRLEDDLDVSRGDMIARPANRPTVADVFDATVCWMSERPLREGGRYSIKHTTRSARAVVRQLRYRIDVNTLHRDLAAEELGLNDIGRVTLRLSAPLAFDTYSRNRMTGSFVLIDEATNDTVGSGMILGAHGEDPGGNGDGEGGAAAVASPNVTWHAGSVERDERWDALGQRGAVVWMTGLPSSGKSTIAHALEQRLVGSGQPAYVLDGDNLRHGLNGDLGFSDEDRAENVRRTAHVARLLADAGVVAIVSLVSPFAADRAQARELVEAEGLPFSEVWVSTPLEECEQRDPKGLYKKARAGELPGFTGVDGPYEPPELPDFELGSDVPVDDAVERLVDALQRN
ncbi:MAG: bifunctional enzyme CysN/CysC [Thermoleophilaceae bacterium]|nr:bifunctional enzyme CysN/CysC [Thermoleophilaceae bacterium]